MLGKKNKKARSLVADEQDRMQQDGAVPDTEFRTAIEAKIAASAANLPAPAAEVSKEVAELSVFTSELSVAEGGEDELSDDYSLFCTTAELAQSASVGDCAGKRVTRPVGEIKVALLVGPAGQLSAVQSSCPHQGGPLGAGVVERQADGRGVLVCPWHQWKFDVDTGVCEVGDIEDSPRPCSKPGKGKKKGGAQVYSSSSLPVFDVRVRGEEVYVSTIRK